MSRVLIYKLYCDKNIIKIHVLKSSAGGKRGERGKEGGETFRHARFMVYSLLIYIFMTFKLLVCKRIFIYI